MVRILQRQEQSMMVHLDYVESPVCVNWDYCLANESSVPPHASADPESFGGAFVLTIGVIPDVCKIWCQFNHSELLFIHIIHTH